MSRVIALSFQQTFIIFTKVQKIILVIHTKSLWVNSIIDKQMITYNRIAKLMSFETQVNLLNTGGIARNCLTKILTSSVVLNLFYSISHFATPNLNIPPPPCNEFWHFVINTIAKYHNSTQHIRSPQTSLLGTMHRIQTNFIVLRAANIVFKKSLKTSRSAQRMRYRRPWACPGSGGTS